jgi:hypothetical protein
MIFFWNLNFFIPYLDVLDPIFEPKNAKLGRVTFLKESI